MNVLTLFLSFAFYPSPDTRSSTALLFINFLSQLQAVYWHATKHTLYPLQRFTTTWRVNLTNSFESETTDVPANTALITTDVWLAVATALLETAILECFFLRGCFAYNSVLQNVLLNFAFIGPCISNTFSEYNQQDATFLNLFISVRCSTCLRRVFRYCYLLIARPGYQQVAVTVWQIPDAVCAVLRSWWWTENPS